MAFKFIQFFKRTTNLQGRCCQICIQHICTALQNMDESEDQDHPWKDKKLIALKAWLHAKIPKSFLVTMFEMTNMSSSTASGKYDINSNF